MSKTKRYKPNLTKWPKFRASEEENAWLVAEAAKSGVSLTGFLRAKCLAEFFEAEKNKAAAEGVTLTFPKSKTKNPRPRRVLPELAALQRILGHLGTVGGNLNQLAHQANAGHFPEAIAIKESLAQIRHAGAVVLEVIDGGDHGASN